MSPKLSQHQCSLFVAFVFMMNALSPAWVTLMSDGELPGNGLTPICTAYGIKYVSLDGGRPAQKSPIVMMEHCPLCVFELTAFGATMSNGVAIANVDYAKASYVATPRLFSPAKIQGYASRAPPFYS